MLWLAVVVVLVAGCSSPQASKPMSPQTQPTEPYVLVLGTAQDGGLPQIGCRETRCVQARDRSSARLVASLLLCDPRSGKRWLIDASPDLREQVVLAEGHPSTRKHEGARPPLFDGIFLTHAHIGHYTGLMYLGRESYGASAVPTYATARMGEFLRTNGPWSQLVKLGNIELSTLTPGTPVELADDLRIAPFVVPHRDELSDTVGFAIHGPSKMLIYIPDIDKWEKWDKRIEDEVAAASYALLDGTFYADGEIPGRSMGEIPHPFIAESMKRFGALPESERNKIWFTHLNHTNAAADAGGDAAKNIAAQGMHVARDGQILPL